MPTCLDHDGSNFFRPPHKIAKYHPRPALFVKHEASCCQSVSHGRQRGDSGGVYKGQSKRSIPRAGPARPPFPLWPLSAWPERSWQNPFLSYLSSGRRLAPGGGLSTAALERVSILARASAETRTKSCSETSFGPAATALRKPSSEEIDDGDGGRAAVSAVSAGGRDTIGPVQGHNGPLSLAHLRPWSPRWYN